MATSSLIGREVELAELAERGMSNRLVTVVGPGGVGEEFRVRWAAHNVKVHRTGTKRFHHRLVGDLTLDYEALDLAADPGQRLLVYQAEPGSPSHDALNLLASWITAAPAELGAEFDDLR